MEPYAVQIMAGYAMLRGMLAEMQTGEGKTLTAVLPTCCAALGGIPVHVITVNDYLVERDAEGLRPLYETFGLSVGIVRDSDTELADRRTAYAADITYVTNKQIAFDYLRDRIARRDGRSRMALDLMARSGRESPLALRGLCYAIIDEADSVLIDEAATPLILSQTVESGDLERLSREALEITEGLKETEHFRIDAAARRIELSDQGRARLEEVAAPLEGIWCGQRRREELALQALQARYLYLRDDHYLVRDGKVMIIDRNTGRLMPDRSWEMGLHQMIEVKEGLEISGQRKTIARISYQKFYRRYVRLCGMTGTAREVRGELARVYDLPTITIPTRRPVQRKQTRRDVFATADQKWAAVVERSAELHAAGRPILIGTRSVGESEALSQRLGEAGLEHEVLNARQDHREAEIVAEAGQPGRITVATHMAGRGTDIKLGPGVLEAGGLHVISTGRSESRRVDRQLFGRCGRQGDPGSYECLDSLEDETVVDATPAWLQALLARIRTRHPSLGLELARAWVGLLQHSNENRSERARSALTRSEDDLERALAFAGEAE
jgi:preprotein translocase subunit SecA